MQSRVKINLIVIAALVVALMTGGRQAHRQRHVAPLRTNVFRCIGVWRQYGNEQQPKGRN